MWTPSAAHDDDGVNHPPPRNLRERTRFKQFCGVMSLGGRNPSRASSDEKIWGRNVRSIGLGSAMLMMSFLGASAQVINAPQVGGPGGGPLDDACRSGDVMIGYNVISGKAMNTFAAVCQAQNNGVLVGKNYGLRTWGKDNGVGLGGTYHEFATPRCPAGSAVSEMNVWVNKVNELDSVAATCSPLRPNTGGVSSLQRTTTNGGEAARQGSSGCPKGTIAVGITGHSGALVDGLGLKCSAFPWH